MMTSYIENRSREKARELRKQKLSYRYIGELLGCSTTHARSLCLYQRPSFTRSKKNYHVAKKYE